MILAGRQCSPARDSLQDYGSKDPGTDIQVIESGLPVQLLFGHRNGAKSGNLCTNSSTTSPANQATKALAALLRCATFGEFCVLTIPSSVAP